MDGQRLGMTFAANGATNARRDEDGSSCFAASNRCWDKCMNVISKAKYR